MNHHRKARRLVCNILFMKVRPEGSAVVGHWPSMDTALQSILTLEKNRTLLCFKRSSRHAGVFCTYGIAFLWNNERLNNFPTIPVSNWGERYRKLGRHIAGR